MQIKQWGTLAITSASLIATVAMWEGTEYEPYRDVVGVLTVCNGYTGPGIVPGKVYTKAECDALLVQDLTAHGQGVLACTKVPINQNQYEALASFAFNVGVRGACTSRAMSLINQERYTEGCKALAHGPVGHRVAACNTPACRARREGNADPAWSYAGGTFYRGLHNRRLAERDQCLKPVHTEIG